MIKFIKTVDTCPPATAAGKSPFDQVRKAAAEQRSTVSSKAALPVPPTGDASSSLS